MWKFGETVFSIRWRVDWFSVALCLLTEKSRMDVTTQDQATVVRLVTEDMQDATASHDTGERLNQLVYDGVRYLVLDLSGVEYLGGSAALGVFMMLRKLMLAGEGVLLLRNPSGPVWELLHLTRLSELFDIQGGAAP